MSGRVGAWNGWVCRESSLGKLRKLGIVVIVAATIAMAGIARAADVVSVWKGGAGGWTDSNSWINTPAVAQWPKNGNGGYSYQVAINDSGAEVSLPGGLYLDSLAIGNARAAMEPSAGVLRLGGLVLSNGATLDLGDNGLIIHATPETRQQVLHQVSYEWIKSAWNNGQWTGAGLTSSAARAQRGGQAYIDTFPSPGRASTGLVPLLNDQGNGRRFVSTFGGIDVGLNDILVKYTWTGDINLDGKVDINDYFRIDSGFITQRAGYQNGDLNFDGVIDIEDYFLIDGAWIATANGRLSGAVSVPEPGGMMVVAAVGLGLVKRRRR